MLRSSRTRGTRRRHFVTGLAGALVTLAAGTPARAADEPAPPNAPWGLGIIVGEPTGLSGLHAIGRHRAIDFGAAWSLDGDSMHLHADHLWFSFGRFPVSEGTLALHYGIGGRARVHDNGGLGPRFPVGLTYWLPGGAVSLFGEVAPVMELVEDTHLDVEGGLGARYLFR